MTAPVVEIRRADAGDAAVISRLGMSSFKATYAHTANAADFLSHVDDYFSEVAVSAELGKPGRWYLLATLDEEPAGFVKLRDSDKHDCVPGGRALEIQQLYVAPDRQRHGLGGRLIEAAMNLAGFMGVDGCWLSVWEDAPWAVNAYDKYGFEKVGTAEFRIGRTAFTDAIMYLAL